MERTPCRLCEVKPPRRFCPGVGGDICARCCGVEREMTVDCPFDCEYLAAAREHDRPVQLGPGDMPHPDVRVTDQFLAENQELAVAAGRMLLMSAAAAGNPIDLDFRDALEALVRTYRTRESGLVYDTRPANPIAAALQAGFEQELGRLREAVAQRSGVHSIRDKDVLGILVFWSRAERTRNNGRRRGRAFFDSLRTLVPPAEPDTGAGRIIT